MKIALTKKIITKKERKMRILEHHFLKEITVEKAPREIPPPPLPPSFPSCESPTTCKDETYRRSRRPSYRIRRQMARKKKNISANYIQHYTKKR